MGKPCTSGELFTLRYETKLQKEEEMEELSELEDKISSMSHSVRQEFTRISPMVGSMDALSKGNVDYHLPRPPDGEASEIDTSPRTCIEGACWPQSEADSESHALVSDKIDRFTAGSEPASQADRSPIRRFS